MRHVEHLLGLETPLDKEDGVHEVLPCFLLLWGRASEEEEEEGRRRGVLGILTYVRFGGCEFEEWGLRVLGEQLVQLLFELHNVHGRLSGLGFGGGGPLRSVGAKHRVDLRVKDDEMLSLSFDLGIKALNKSRWLIRTRTHHPRPLEFVML